MASTSPSLLERLRDPSDEDSWQRMIDIYTPMMRGWIRRQSSGEQDVEDIVQEVLANVIRKIPDFVRIDQTGAFRSWLRTITVNCLRNSWRKKKFRPVATGDSDFAEQLEQLGDPSSELSKQWNRDHDQFVMQYLLTLIQPQFSEQTWKAFVGVAIEERPAEEVAAELEMSVNSVYLARHRVTTKLRNEGRGLIDWTD